MSFLAVGQLARALLLIAGSAAASGTATPVPDSFAAAADGPLKSLVQAELPTLSSAGPGFSAPFAQEQTDSQSATCEPGECDGAVGVGVGITDLEATLVVAGPGGARPCSRKTGTRARPRLWAGGAPGGCVRYPLPQRATGKVVLRAVQGSGVASAQRYAKQRRRPAGTSGRVRVQPARGRSRARGRRLRGRWREGCGFRAPFPRGG